MYRNDALHVFGKAPFDQVGDILVVVSRGNVRIPGAGVGSVGDNGQCLRISDITVYALLDPLQAVSMTLQACNVSYYNTLPIVSCATGSFF